MTPRHFLVPPAPRRKGAPSRDAPPVLFRVFWAHAFLDS